MRIEFLDAHRDLLPHIAALLHQEWGHLRPWASIPEIETRLAASIQADSGMFTLLAFAPDVAFLGTAGVRLRELSGRPDRTHWLREVFVPRAYRGRGIGTGLVRACIDRAAGIGISRLYLYTPDRQALYRRLGWRVIEDAIVNGESVSIMLRSTSAKPQDFALGTELQEGCCSALTQH